MFLDKCLVAHYLKAPLVWPVSFPAVASCKTSEIRPDMGNGCMLESHMLKKQLWRETHKEGTETMCEYMQ